MSKSSPRVPQPVVSALASVVSVAEGAVVYKAWTACDIGVNSATNLVIAAVVVVALFIGHLVLGSIVRLLAPGRLIGLVAVLAAFAVAAIAVGIYVVTPDKYAQPVCPASVPPWWPDWLPS